MRKIFGFTLAEVLITLSIIGVVAALTIPSVISNYNKKATESRLAKFYSVINQAIQRSEIDNGDSSTWISSLNAGSNSAKIDQFVNTFILPYLKGAEYDNIYKLVYMPDGSAFMIYDFDEIHFTTDVKRGKASMLAWYMGDSTLLNEIEGRKSFVFSFVPAIYDPDDSDYRRGIEPYDFEESVEYLTTRCKETGSYTSKYGCTALIAKNGWKIPKDYSLRF